MTTKSELQTLLGTLNDTNGVWDALHHAIYELDTLKMLLEEMAYYTRMPSPNDKDAYRDADKNGRKTVIVISLIETMKTQLRLEADKMEHLIFAKAVGLVEEMIAIEDEKLAKEKATELVN